MIPTADTELHGYKNIIDNSLLHQGANWTGRAKAGDAAPTPTTRAKKKREIQARLLSTDINKKTRRTFSAQTRDMPLGRRVNSQLDMKVTTQRRKCIRSSLKMSCYVERHSVEGGVMSILNHLAITYYFGQASATPDRKRSSESTGHPSHPTIRNHVVN